jgi:hypothetical protein
MNRHPVRTAGCTLAAAFAEWPDKLTASREQA